MTLESLQKIREEIDALISQEEEKAEQEKLKGPHKKFYPGDIVTDGEKVGRVKWTSNSGVGIPFDHGKMGIDIINGNRGFWAGARRNDFNKVPDFIYEYLQTPQKITLELTGEEIEAIFSGYFGLRNVNPDKTRIKMLDVFEKHRIDILAT